MRRYLAAAAVAILSLLLALAPAAAQEAPAGESPAGVSPEGVTIQPLFEIDLGADALPEDLSGVLVFRKVYPVTSEISYNASFIPPNTFVRYVESGQLGLRPHAEMRVIRASDTSSAEIVPAEAEVVVGPGDTFIQGDLPYEEYGADALGSMWHEGSEDATVVGFAIREASRCCAMTHGGMQSPWHATMAGPAVKALIGEPLTFRMERLRMEPGATLAGTVDDPPVMRLVDAGVVIATKPASGEVEERVIEYDAGMSFTERPFGPAADFLLANPGPEPAVLLQLVMEPTG